MVLLSVSILHPSLPPSIDCTRCQLPAHFPVSFCLNRGRNKIDPSEEVCYEKEREKGSGLLISGTSEWGLRLQTIYIPGSLCLILILLLQLHRHKFGVADTNRRAATGVPAASWGLTVVSFKQTAWLYLKKVVPFYGWLFRPACTLGLWWM